MLKFRQISSALWNSFKWSSISIGISVLALAQASPEFAFAKTPDDCVAAITLPWSKRITFADTERTLRNARVIDMQEMKSQLRANGKKESGTSPVVLVTLEGGMRAVFKPNIWNNMADGEEGAYRIARRLLKIRIIPPTVRRDLGADLERFRGNFSPEFFARFSKATEGSLQYFVESTIDFKNDSVAKEVWPKVSKIQKSAQDLYYFVFGQWDRHRGNLIVDDTYTLALIDNTGIRMRQQVRFGEPPFRARIWMPAQISYTDRSDSFPFDEAKVFDHPSIEDLHDYLKDYIDLKQWNDFAAHMGPRRDGKPRDLSCKIVVWRKIIWVQGIGFENYGPIIPEVIRQKDLDAYASLTFENMRRELSPKAFTDVAINEMLGRRDQILKAAETIPRVP